MGLYVRKPNPDVYYLISDPVRREILDALLEREMSVSEIVDMFPITQSAISQHLRLLREGNLVGTRKEGRTVYYYIAAEPLRLIDDWLKNYEKFWTDKLNKLEKLLNQKFGDKNASKRDQS